MNTDDNATAEAQAGTGFEAEASAAIAGIPEEQNAQPAGERGEGVQLADDAQPWAPFLQQAVRPILFGVVLPQWQVSDAEQDQWTDALAACCDQLFPGGPAGKYAPYVRLAFMSAAIVGTRAVAGGGKLPPFGPKLANPKDAAASA